MDVFFQTIVKGFTYDGALTHIVVNYLVLAMVMAPFAACRRDGRPTYLGGVRIFLIAFALQVALWFAFDSSGVSIIWSCLAGYTLLEMLRNPDSCLNQRRRLTVVSLITACLGLVYYVFTTPFITTDIHLIAVALGMGLSWAIRAWK